MSCTKLRTPLPISRWVSWPLTKHVPLEQMGEVAGQAQVPSQGFVASQIFFQRAEDWAIQYLQGHEMWAWSPFQDRCSNGHSQTSAHTSR